MTAKSSMSARERRLRSRLLQLVREGGLLHGNLVERTRKCGNPNCRCQRGEGHRGLYLAHSREGRQRQLYIPRAWEQRVREWEARYREVRDLLEELGDMYRERVKRREDSSRSGDSDAT